MLMCVMSHVRTYWLPKTQQQRYADGYRLAAKSINFEQCEGVWFRLSIAL